MTTQDPKPARRIPDEGPFMVHFTMLYDSNTTFDAQITDPSEDAIERILHKSKLISQKHITLYQPTKEHPGRIYTGHKLRGTFTITPPTLKGDPDEPT